MAHCGPSVSGSFVQTLVVTDIATGWTECAPLLVRSTELVPCAQPVSPNILIELSARPRDVMVVAWGRTGVGWFVLATNTRVATIAIASTVATTASTRGYVSTRA